MAALPWHGSPRFARARTQDVCGRFRKATFLITVQSLLHHTVKELCRLGHEDLGLIVLGDICSAASDRMPFTTEAGNSLAQLLLVTSAGVDSGA